MRCSQKYIFPRLSCASPKMNQNPVTTSSAFPFSGQKPRPVKLPIFRFVIARIFYMIPYTEGKLKQLVSYLFGVVDSIFISAELKPPKIIVAVAVRHMISDFKVFFLRQLSCPLRRNKRSRLRSFAIVCLSSVCGAAASPYSPRASRPWRYSAPESSAKILSPEQSIKISALI